MKVIILHHLEPCWDEGLRRMGTSFEELAVKVIEHLEENDYNRVILTRFEDNRLNEEHHIVGLGGYVDQIYDYGYGWERSMINDGCFYDSQKWVDGGNHSEIVLIDEWMEELKRDEVYLCGAFDGECIEDMEIALSGADVEFSRIEKLIV